MKRKRQAGQVFTGITSPDHNFNYSWTTGAVIVPAYDSSANATGLIIDANLGLTVGNTTITSFQVR